MLLSMNFVIRGDDMKNFFFLEIVSDTPTSNLSIRYPICWNYFGGPKKGGAAPSATGFMVASSSSQAFNAAAPALRPNFLFNFRQNSALGYPGSGGPLL